MNETKIEICRLCFTLLNEEPNFINKLQEQMLQIIVPDVKLGTSQFPLICKPCTKNLEEAFGFKSSFLELEDSIHGFVNEDQAQVDLEEVIGIKETSNISKNERICRTCFRLSENNSYEKLGKENDSLMRFLQMCLPEIKVDLTKEPVVCQICIAALNKNYEFVNMCLKNEEKINSYKELSNQFDSVNLYEVLQYTWSKEQQNMIHYNHMEADLKIENFIESNIFHRNEEVTLKIEDIEENSAEVVDLEKENENQVTISSTNENYVFLISDDDEITTTSSNGILSKSRHIAVVPENNINTSKGKSKRRSHMVAAQKLKAGTDGIEELSDTDNIYSRKSESSDEDEGYTSIETKKRKTGGKKQQTPKQTTQLNLRKTVSVSEVINRSIHVFDDDFEYIRESISNRTITDMRKSSSIPENTARQPGLVTINFNNRKAQLDLIVEISDEDDTPATNKNKRHVPNILRSVKKTMEKSDVTSKTNSTCSAESESGSTDHSSAESDNSDSEFSRNNRQGEAIVISDDEVVACACSHCVKEAILIKCALKKLHRCTYCLNERTNKKDNNGLDVEHQCSNVDTPPRRQFNKDDKLFNCLRCVFQAHNKSFISNHILDYHVQQKMSFFRCSSCFTDYKFEWQVHCHKNATVLAYYSCPFCTLKFERKRKLTSHVFRHLGGDYSVRYYCRLCFVQHEDETKLKDHLLEHKAPEEVVTYKCMKCLYQARSRAHVKEHIRKGHGQGKITCLAQVEKKTIEEDENIYVECPICKKYLNSKYAISHKQQHKFPCDMCPYNSTSLWWLQKHKELHTLGNTNTVFTCKICHQIFKKHFGLTLHNKVHRVPSTFHE